MYRTYLYGKLSQKSQCVKILSVKKGQITLSTIEDAMIYAYSQGLDFEDYAKKGTIVYYALELAQMMEDEKYYWLAAKCYFEALGQSWRDYIDINILKLNKMCRRAIPPQEIYDQALEYLERIKKSEWIQEFKYENLEWRNYANQLRESHNNDSSENKGEVF